MFCTNCGNQLTEGAKFCTKCGAKAGEQHTLNVINPKSLEKMNRVQRLWMGRIGRLNYFLGTLFGLILTIIPLVLFVAIWGVIQFLSANGTPGSFATVIAILNITIPLLVALSIVIPLWGMYTVLGIRRAHDLGHSGWFSLLTQIPYIGIIFIIYFLSKKGEPQRNDYGFPPAHDRRFLADVFNR